MNGNMSGEDRAAVRGHRAGSGSTGGSAYGGSAYGGSNRDDGSSSTEGEQQSPPVNVSASAKSGVTTSNKHKLHHERVWCDGCGRGWIKGTPEACECDDNGGTKPSRTAGH